MYYFKTKQINVRFVCYDYHITSELTMTTLAALLVVFNAGREKGEYESGSGNQTNRNQTSLSLSLQTWLAALSAAEVVNLF